ncbi:hypothetical protein CH63R_02832 [Colletotrichum higginsianum IMI 349063]|uniref:Uncharacterized protein n=1 Tax=Colletotrichum higginsianum (strain IMI 349063) TaxID=759273 RepID=A0A1B7YPY3_COLHI|nr:hypothetical protein CH63R_02832 [Colletotrichum higginsianum IMI 349063]OBR14106.1 hypothetical protein CH63R_02832 [Colletotrichum higginsianum IMI 349063]
MLPSAPGLREGQAVGDPITSSPLSLSLSTRRSYPPAMTFLVKLLRHPDKPNIRSHPSIFPASIEPVKPAPRYLYTTKTLDNQLSSRSSIKLQDRPRVSALQETKRPRPFLVEKPQGRPAP